MNEHTKTDGLPETLQVLERSRPRNERMATDKIECNACPVLCQMPSPAAHAELRLTARAGAWEISSLKVTTTTIRAKAVVAL